MLNKLEMLRIFVTAAETPSFKEAAIRLGISPQAVTRAIQELEQHQGELLFHRNTRGNHITDFGLAFAARARDTVSAMDTLFQAKEDDGTTGMRGLVRLTAPRALGRTHLLPLMLKLAAQYPMLSLDLRLSDQLADVVDDQIDLGLRIGPLRDSRFVAKPVAKVAFHIVATPDLLARTGIPASPESLATLPCTVLMDANTGRPWPWMLAHGQHWQPAQVAFTTDDSEAECSAVLAGVGFGQLADFQVAPYLASGQLIAVLAPWAPPSWDLYVYRPQRGPVPARIRLLFDQLVAHFSANASIDSAHSR